ncbi:MAG: hypothetical protein ACP5M4_15645, partial [Acidobacteriaceae bacterium]
ASQQPIPYLACLNFIMQSTLRKEWPSPDGYKITPQLNAQAVNRVLARMDTNSERECRRAPPR